MIWRPGFRLYALGASVFACSGVASAEEQVPVASFSPLPAEPPASPAVPAAPQGDPAAQPRSGVASPATVTAPANSPDSGSTDESHLADMDPVEPKSMAHWYGWQALAADTTSLVLLAADGRSEPVRYTAYAIYGVAAPIIHGLHDRAATGVGSLVMRAGLPLLSAALVTGGHFGADCRSGPEDPDQGCLVAAELSPLLGAFVAVVIDDGFLAREQVPVPKTDRALVQWHLAPVVASRRGGLSVTGVF